LQAAPSSPVAARTELAIQDLENRTLAAIPSALGRLVYLASTRDYNSGDYHHEGFFFRFGADAGAVALETCHQRAFQAVLLVGLQDLTEEIETYMQATGDPAKTMMAWRRLKAYQLLIPVPCDPVSASLFSSNIQLALGVLVIRGLG
jgi:hypothetical protein